jgi:hypothetical protein
MTKHVHMSPPQARESSDGPKLFRRILAIIVVGGTIVWGGGNGHQENVAKLATPVTKLASQLSDRWDQSVAKAPHVLPPLLRREDAGAHSKAVMKDASLLGSQAAPSLGARARKRVRSAQ